MMIAQVANNLYFADMEVCESPPAGWAVVHACKDPCHKRAVGYEKALPRYHRDYFAKVDGQHLYLNMIDPPLPLFVSQTFLYFFGFVDQQIVDRPVVIHCNQGVSRAPSLAMLYAAKRYGRFDPDDYELAAAAFAKTFRYEPNTGIASYLRTCWKLLGQGWSP